ncbi:MAG: ABC transporter permease [Bacteroidales bacterium]|nr:ABC transporter permease [Bacteroidales bacterium]
MNTKHLLQRIKKNRLWFSLNALGLSIAFACLLLVYSFIRVELSYDRFHSKADRIYRLTLNTNTGISSMIDARTFTGMSSNLQDDFAQITDVIRLSSYRNAIVTIDEKTFYSKKVFSVDSSFFNVFDFKLLTGNPKAIFNKPGQIAITKSLAQKYFGSLDVLGKQIEIAHQKEGVVRTYTVQGVLYDFPENSHFNADILCSQNENQENSLDYTYLLLVPGVNPEELTAAIQTKWDKEFAETDYHPIANLQALPDIHLKSHKSRELEQNGSIRSLILLASSLLIILFIAFINFANLNFVQFLKEQKNYTIKIIHGATPRSLIIDSLKETLILSTVYILAGYLMAHYFSMEFSFHALTQITSFEIGVLALITLIIVCSIVMWPFLFHRKSQLLFISALKKRYSFKVFVILQLALSIIAIMATLTLQKQIHHINSLHPDAQNADLIVMPDNPWPSISTYETYKERLLTHPEIMEVSAVMEEPAGIVTDNFPYQLGREESNQTKTINILCIDTNFFSFFHIKPIAGTVNMGKPTSLDWEHKTIQLWQMENRKMEIPESLKAIPKPQAGKYIINKMALGHLGFANAEEAIGKPFRIDFMGQMFPWGEIIGVVDDFHYTNLYVKEKPLVMVSRKIFSHCFLFRIDPNKKKQALSVLQAEWEKLNPSVPFQYEFVTDSYQKVYQKEYTLMEVLSLFSLVSIILSAMGLFAMMAFNLERKVKEIGIRKINGAKVSGIMAQHLKIYTGWVVIAFVVACPISYMAMNSWLESFAYKTTLNWWIFALAGIFTLAIVFLTVGWQIFKAARKNPVESLRYE